MTTRCPECGFDNVQRDICSACNADLHPTAATPIAELAGLRERAAMRLDALAKRNAGTVYGPAYTEAAALVRATPLRETD
jgi:methionyl-tRNA synthetase